MAKNALKEIMIERAEGCSTDAIKCGELYRFAGWEEARAHLMRICRSIPAKRLGYDKTDVMIVWENGDSYTTRYDAAHPDSSSHESTSLAQSILSSAAFYMGLARPGHITEERYRHLVGQGYYKAYGRQLAQLIFRCEIPGADAFIARHNLKPEDYT